MNRNLFVKELQRNAVSLIVWIAVITVLICLTMAAYPMFLENQSKIMAIINIVPKAALQFKGISNIADLLSVVGFYSVNNVLYMMVLGSIFSIVLSSNIILKEEYLKTAEFLFTWPLTRFEIFISKLGVVLINVFVLNLVTATAGFLAIRLVNKGPFDVKPFLSLSIYTFLLTMFFASLGLFISTIIKKSRPVTTFSIGLVMVLYIIQTISKITEGISWIGYISPFRYAPVDAMSVGYRLEPLNVMYFLGLTLMFLGFAWNTFNKKDIYL